MCVHGHMMGSVSIFHSLFWCLLRPFGVHEKTCDSFVSVCKSVLKMFVDIFSSVLEYIFLHLI